jgi:hypothetical protein
MSRNQSRSAIVAVACALVAYASPARAAGSVSTDPCTLLTADQVKSAVGVDIAPGVPISKTACQCRATGQNRQMATVALEPGASWSKMKAALPTAKKMPLPGVGDDAFYEDFGAFASLGVKKGDTVFIVRVYGVADTDKQKAIEKALAKNVAAKL